MSNQFSLMRMFVPLAASVSTSVLVVIPGLAFTLSSSEGTFEINNFSVLPLDVQSFQDTNTQAIAPDGKVQSNADANSLFLADQSNPASSKGNGFSSSIVSGNGNDYSGLAQSVAQVVGYTFQIEAGTKFSFDFNASLNLNTSVDQPGVENATAIGSIGLGLFDAADPNNSIPLEFLTIASNLGVPVNSNALEINQSGGVTFSASQTSLDSFLGGRQAVASASVQGTLSHYFASPTSLNLVEFSFNQATAAVPEPSTVLASFLCVGFLGARLGLKPKLDRKS